MPVIDSSTLISFAKIGSLNLLIMLKGQIVTIQEVYDECVEKGIALGYADALRVKKMFDNKHVIVENVKRSALFSGVSIVDSKVISLAKEKKDYLFADDVKLGRRARAEDVEVRNTPDMLLQLLRTNRIKKKEFANLLQLLVDHKRLSKKSKELYLKAGG